MDVSLFWELLGLSPNFHIHASVSHLNIPRIGPHTFPAAEQADLIYGIYKYKLLTDTWMWKLGPWPRNSLSGNICFKFSAFLFFAMTRISCIANFYGFYHVASEEGLIY